MSIQTMIDAISLLTDETIRRVEGEKYEYIGEDGECIIPIKEKDIPEIYHNAVEAYYEHE